MQQSVGDKEPESQSFGLQIRETARWAREPSAFCKERAPEPGGQQSKERVPEPGGQQSKVLSPAEQSLQRLMPREISVAWSSTGVWRSAVSAVVWSLPHLYLESGICTPPF